MSVYLLIYAIIIITCVFLNKFSGKVGIPVLLFFLMLGLLCGSGDDTIAATEGKFVGDFSTIALIFIMFYGGFGTRWKSARPIIVEAGLLATVGVALTAAFVALFCHFVMKWGWSESFLLGAVVSSTDAATVFSILRTRKLGLKNNTAPILEVESGSNDPMSYMLTAVAISLITGTASAGNIAWTIFAQMAFGVGAGLLISTGAVWLLRRVHIKNNGFDLLLVISIALMSYAVPDLIGGNGYLSTYIVGIVVGNCEFPGRKSLVSVFDVITCFMQIAIFFMLGRLANPSNLLYAIVPSLLIFAFLTLAARPLAVFGVLAPFRKYSANQIGLISFSGLRGAASIVFAIMIITSNLNLEHDIFNIVFCIVLISIGLQGSLIPSVAKKLKMIDETNDVMTTFSDFRENSEMSFACINVTAISKWNNKTVKELALPYGCVLLDVLRGDEHIVPDGQTLLREGDRVVVGSNSFEDDLMDNLIQHTLPVDSKWDGHLVKEYSKAKSNLIVLIQRGEERIIPKGHTTLQSGDVLYFLERNL